MENNMLLQVHNMYKSFGETKALKDTSIGILSGEIHGIIGENGSGKSTVSSIIAGMQKFDEGQMLFKGKEYLPRDIFQAQKMGIAMIGQEQSTFEDISVAENIFVGKEDFFRKGLIVNAKKMNVAARGILDDVGLEDIQETEKVKKLDFEQRKLVEIARALYEKPEILIVDETSTTLSEYGRGILYSNMQKLKESGKSVIFISHDIEEIMERCDRVTILRDGSIIDTLDKKDYDSHTIKQLMVGREIEENFYRKDYEYRLTDEIALSAKEIHTEVLQDVSVDLHYGEILGVGGLTDCGMHELGQILFGLKLPIKGAVKAGDETKISSPVIARKMKMAYISKNRDKEALMLSSTIKENICLPSYDKIKKRHFITNKNESKFTEENAKPLQIKMHSINQNVRYLSGGNKQKVAVSKWLGTEADVYIFDCPTRGIDVGVKADIYRLLEKLKQEKKAILMISEELPELIGMSDRIVILKKGQISYEVSRAKDITENKLIEYII